MGPGETFVALAGMGVGLGLIGWGAELVKRWIAYKEKALALTAEGAAGRATNAELEERLRVLERIVTDKGYDVASQIEALRDTRRVDELLENRTEKETN